MNIRLSRLDSSKANIVQQKSLARKINCIMNETGIINVWRNANPSGWNFTHFSAPHSTYSRIDCFFTFSKDQHKIKTSNIGTMDLSDHAPVYLSICVDEVRKSTTWRLNSNILNDLNIREKLSKEIDLYFQENDKGM